MSRTRARESAVWISFGGLWLSLGLVLSLASPALAQETFYAVAESRSSSLAPPTCPDAWCQFDLGFCLPFDFDSIEPQPISRSPGFAYGACSDAVWYEAMFDQGTIEFFGQILPPFDVTIGSGTDITYDLLIPSPQTCDAATVGQPGPIVSPCWLLSVRITETASYWTLEDDTGGAPFTITGAAPTARLPEPGLIPSLVVTTIALAWSRRVRGRDGFAHQ